VIQTNGPPSQKSLALQFFVSAFWLHGLLWSGDLHAQTSAAVSSQTRQDQQLRQQLEETDPLGGGPKSLAEETVTARPLSRDMGDVQLLSEKEKQPWFFFTVDTQAFYNSNVLYASSISDTFGAWQIITTPEIGFAPRFKEEKYSMFFPRLGFRYQFYSYAQAEPYPSGITSANPQYTVANNNFRVANPYASLGWAFTDDLYLEFSFQGNIYTSNSPNSDPQTFLSEYPIAWQATWFESFATIHSFSITGRASYVFANSTPSPGAPNNNQFSRTDNNLTFSWGTNPTKELNTQVYASFRLAKYTGSDNDPNSSPFSALGYIDESDRLDFQQTYGASITWTPIEYLSLRGFVSWTKSDTSVAEPVTGQFEGYNAGTGLNLIYRF